MKEFSANRWQELLLPSLRRGPRACRQGEQNWAWRTRGSSGAQSGRLPASLGPGWALRSSWHPQAVADPLQYLNPHAGEALMGGEK